MFTALSCDNLRELLNEMNKRSIRKEDIVTMMNTSTGYTVIYLKHNNNE